MIKKSVFFIGLLLASSSPVFAALQEYKIDPNHTHVIWHVSHFGFSYPSGKWMAEGKLAYDPEKVETSKVVVEIPIAKLLTGLDKFDRHLLSKDFLDANKFPKATFESDKIEVTGENTFNIHGTLNLHGVSKPVVLQATKNKAGVLPVNNKETIGFSAKGTINRSDFGISKYAPNVGNDVELSIELEANK